CNLVVTDSGGLQKEAFFNKKHCIIARDETEWVELVSNGFAKIVNSDQSEMYKAFNQFNQSSKDFDIKLYGENVGEKVYHEIISIC
ncbi:UDP-N-acetylglucosamine 2-epimerase, partial [Gilvimarinus sp. SDUM040013]|uniref:UDP-N-acetylglucosamine 2-epimerase n=1 Tax=Gilvimarinus gilvus TaxID=3058038 RepID=UPI002672E14F